MSISSPLQDERAYRNLVDICFAFMKHDGYQVRVRHFFARLDAPRQPHIQTRQRLSEPSFPRYLTLSPAWKRLHSAGTH